MPGRRGAYERLPASGENAFERKTSGGAQDTDDNAADFEGPKAGDPQDTGGDTPPPEPDVTRDPRHPGSPARSRPSLDKDVTIEGVVTGIDDEIGASFGSNNTIRRFPEDAGIFVQEESADADSNPDTSEGIFVGYVRDRNAYKPGDVVRINGQVKGEIRPDHP